MDLFNTKKIEELYKLYNSNCTRLCSLEKDNRTLKQIAFEQYKKSNKPKFKIGDNLQYTVCGHSRYTFTGIVYRIEPMFNYADSISYYYHLSFIDHNNNGTGGAFEGILTKVK